MDAPRLALLSLMLAAAACVAAPEPTRLLLSEYRAVPQEPLPRSPQLPRDAGLEPSPGDPNYLDGEDAGADSMLASLDLLIGYRQLSGEVGEVGSGMATVAVEAFLRPRGYAIGVELGLAGSWASSPSRFYDDESLSNTMFDLYGGPRLQVPLGGVVEWFLSAGATASWLTAEREDVYGDLLSDTGFDFGAYAHTGLRFSSVEGPHLDLDIRFVGDLEEEFFGERQDFGYWQAGLGFGGTF